MGVGTIKLRIQTDGEGRPVYEEVLVRSDGGRRYRVECSPGLVLGIAAGDVIDVRDDGTFEVIRRGGNLCIQIFSRTGIAELERFATPLLAGMGGRRDGQAPKELVYTVPVTVGFAAIEQILNRIMERFPAAEWVYGNVYDVADGVTPLGWWEHLPKD